MEVGSGEDESGEGPRKGGGSQRSSNSPTNNNSSSSKPTRTHDERWEESFRRLVAFQEKHGHCNIPYRYEEDPFLGRWVSLQRSIYKSEAAAYGASSTGVSALPRRSPPGDDDGTAAAQAASTNSKEQQKSRIQRLNEIGFDWNPQESRHVSWEQRYAELCDFVARNGHARVPLGWKENIQLAHWVSAQRREYKLLRKGLPSRLTHDRLQKLEKINFLWRAGRGGPRVPTSGRDPVQLLQPEVANANYDPSGGVEGVASAADPAAANPTGPAIGSGYTLPPGTAYLLTNAGAFPAILAQPSALAPLQGQQPLQNVTPTPVDPSQAANTTTTAAAAAAATVLNLFPILAQTAAAAAATTVPAVPATGLATGGGSSAAGAEDPSVAALRLLMNSGVAATPGVGAAMTGASPAAPAAALVIPSLSSAYGTAPPAPAGTLAPSTGLAAGAAIAPAAGAPVLDPQAAMNLALTLQLQLLTRTQSGTGVQPQQQLVAPPMNAADGTGNDPNSETAPR